jgi:succinate dehydrogenase flavin-adding protein (antitoxin of CptAB toxin-antitoxin module)
MVYLYDQGYLRKFQYGNVEVYVQLTEETDDDLLTVWAALLQLPAEDEQRLMRKLLTMNWEET